MCPEVNHVSEETDHCSLTLDDNGVAVDNIIGAVDSFAVVRAAVLLGQRWDLVVRAVAVGGDGVQQQLKVRMVPFEGDRWSA